MSELISAELTDCTAKERADDASRGLTVHGERAVSIMFLDALAAYAVVLRKKLGLLSLTCMCTNKDQSTN
jgi:hypothetical protein